LECYGECYEVDDFEIEYSAFIDINGEGYYDGFVLNIDGNDYLAFNYSFEPNEEIEVEIFYESIHMPFNYYLDSLSTYQSAKHEKITVEGYCDAIFNEHYPINLISNEDNYKTWVWEYSDINTFDENLHDVLIITESAMPDCTPNWECGSWSNWTCDLDMDWSGMGSEAPSEEEIGNMTRGCYDGCGNYRKEYQDCPTPKNANACTQVGKRKSGEYCSSERIWVEQKTIDEICQRDFECQSRNCEEGICKEGSIFFEGFWYIFGILLAVLIILLVILGIVMKKK